MGSIIVAQVFVYFAEMLFVPVIANEAIRLVALSHINDVDTLQFRQEFSYLFDSLVSSGLEERESEIKALDIALRRLDPYSEIIIPSEFKRLLGKPYDMAAGVGVFLIKHDRRTVIVHAIRGSPAKRAGIGIGDELIEIDGTSLGRLDLGETQELLLGDSGSNVNIVLRREGHTEATSYNLRREMITLKKSIARYELINDDVGYIHVLSFLQLAYKEIESIVDSLKWAGARKLIIDLRHNSGGGFEWAVDAVSWFLPQDEEIVEVRTLRKGKPRTLTATKSEKFLEEIPLVVIVNSSTSGGAEIFAGALQDWDRALLLGDTTAGMGTLHYLIGLSFGYGIRLAHALFYLPSGRMFDKPMYHQSNETFTTLKRKRQLMGSCMIPDVIYTQEPTPSSHIEDDAWIREALQILHKAETKEQVFNTDD